MRALCRDSDVSLDPGQSEGIIGMLAHGGVRKKNGGDPLPRLNPWASQGVVRIAVEKT